MCRVVRARANLEDAIAFEIADPFQEGLRQHNPLGKVPALILEKGPPLLETTLILRTLAGGSREEMLPANPAERRWAEADIALMTGILDLGVAYRLEEMRPPEEQSQRWLLRRLRGLEAAIPLLSEAARRAAEDPDGVAAIAFAATGDWLRFRLSGTLSWEDDAPEAARILDDLLSAEDMRATDPRTA
jgi:glutathione S-transferase